MRSRRALGVLSTARLGDQRLYAARSCRCTVALVRMEVLS
jgi:hypothetical protein